MQKEIQPKLINCEYVCASCGNKYNILSTKGPNVSLDVCSNCHPFYVGTTSSSSLRGRAEKLSNKFDAGKQFKAKKTVVSANKTNKEGKTGSGFGSL